MPRKRTEHSLLDLNLRGAMLPLLWWEMYWAAAETIGYRLQRMAAGGLAPDSRQQRENQRMVTEKLEAVWDTWWGALMPDLNAPLALSQAWWQTLSETGTPGFAAAASLQRYPALLWQSALLPAGQATAALETAVEPWQRRVRANARRLRRR